MNVILEKDGEQVSYKAGSAIYMLLSLIPFGGFVTLILNIVYKQFRGIWLNQFIIGLISLVLAAGAVASESYTFLLIAYVLLLAVCIYLLVMYVMNANYYSVKQRIEEGFTVVNESEPEVAAFVEIAKTKKKPFLQITKF